MPLPLKRLLSVFPAHLWLHLPPSWTTTISYCLLMTSLVAVALTSPISAALCPWLPPTLATSALPESPAALRFAATEMASDSAFSPAIASLADVNRKFWNNNARDIFKQAWVRDLAEQVTDALRSNVDWINIRKPSENGEPVRLLDYACGNGVASHALAPYVNQVTGIDLSDTMVDSYNEIARVEGFLEQQMQAVRGNIVSESADDAEALSAPKYFNFDAVVFSFALHHVENPQEYIGKLVQRLVSGGVVVIIDWMPSEKSAEAPGSAQRSEVGKTIKKPSFSAAEMHEFLLNAGCSPDSIDYRPYRETSHIPESMTKVEGGVTKRFFVAKGRKP